MTVENLEEYVRSFFIKRELTISGSGIAHLMHPDFLIRDTLMNMENSRITENVDILLQAIVSKFETENEKLVNARKRWWKPSFLISRSLSKQEIPERLIVQIMNEYFCTLPPYCKN